MFKPNKIFPFLNLKEMVKHSSHHSISHQTWDGENESSSKTLVERKIKLFGFELNTCKISDQISLKSHIEGDESVNSSTTISSTKESSKVSTSEVEENKFICQYCSKRFANSQALGGHQNAHKKERMKKKRLQLQARKASINYYFQSFQTNPKLNFYSPNDSSYHGEPQISFCQFTPEPYMSRSPVPWFTVSHTGKFGENKHVTFNPNSYPAKPKQDLKPLDLHLGLSLHSKSGI